MALYKPEAIALLEPRISGDTANHVCKMIGRKNWVRIEADGFSGGIWVLWDRDFLEMRVIQTHKQFIHLVLAPNTDDEWMLTIVYASPKPIERGLLWKELEAIEASSPWCVIGDFNAVLHSDERSPVGRNSVCFQEWVRKSGMVD